MKIKECDFEKVIIFWNRLFVQIVTIVFSGFNHRIIVNFPEMNESLRKRDFQVSCLMLLVKIK